MSVTALDVAKYILNYFRESHGDSISNLKLQKLLYYAQGRSLGLNNELLFDDEIQAWVHGPVVPSVYAHFKKNGWQPIYDEFKIPTFSKPIQDLLNKVCEDYGGYLPCELERMTHEEYPLKVAREGYEYDQNCSVPLNHNVMKEFFRSK